MKRAIIFDMDGTILDTLDDLRDALNHALLTCGHPQRSREEVLGMVGKGMDHLVASGVPAGLAPEGIAAVMRAFRAHYAIHSTDKTAPYPGVIDLLRRLKTQGYRLAVLSNKKDDAVQALCAQFFPNLFDYAAGELPGVARKPDPAGVTLALEALDCSREEAVYIGDSEVDVATAQNAGLDMVTVTWGFRTPAALLACGAQHLADTPDDVIAQLSAL